MKYYVPFRPLCQGRRQFPAHRDSRKTLEPGPRAGDAATVQVHSTLHRVAGTRLTRHATDVQADVLVL